MSILNPKLEVGDRIVLLNMDDPFGPIKPGTFGTVIGIQKLPFKLSDNERDFHYQIDWDNGSKLSLEPDVDTWVFKSDYDKKKANKNVI